VSEFEPFIPSVRFIDDAASGKEEKGERESEISQSRLSEIPNRSIEQNEHYEGE